MRPNVAVSSLLQLDDASVLQVLGGLLAAHPHLAPGIIHVACPELTYAPAAALSEHRYHGTVTHADPHGVSICSPELQAVFGCNVRVGRRSQLLGLEEGQLVAFAVALTDDHKPQAFDVQKCDAVKTAEGGVSFAAFPAATPMDTATSLAGMPGTDLVGLATLGALSVLPGGLGGLGAGSFASLGEAPSVEAMAALGGLGSTSSLQGLAGADEILGEFLGVVRSVDDKGFGFITTDTLKVSGVSEDAYAHKHNIGDASTEGGKDLKDAKDQALGAFLGTVKSFSPVAGFGFLVCEDLVKAGCAADLYFHQKEVQALSVNVGDKVQFTAYVHQGQLHARELCHLELKSPDLRLVKKRRTDSAAEDGSVVPNSLNNASLSAASASVSPLAV